MKYNPHQGAWTEYSKRPSVLDGDYVFSYGADARAGGRKMLYVAYLGGFAILRTDEYKFSMHFVYRDSSLRLMMKRDSKAERAAAEGQEETRTQT